MRDSSSRQMAAWHKGVPAMPYSAGPRHRAQQGAQLAGGPSRVGVRVGVADPFEPGGEDVGVQLALGHVELVAGGVGDEPGRLRLGLQCGQPLSQPADVCLQGVLDVRGGASRQSSWMSGSVGTRFPAFTSSAMRSLRCSSPPRPYRPGRCEYLKWPQNSERQHMPSETGMGSPG
ncbi:hypothetical protein GCM10020000_70870 [Streptomyces olivoverticillatus]